MQLYLTTPGHTIARDRLGHYELQSRETGKSVYFRGDDARQFEAEIGHCPSRMLDSVLDQYSEVMS